MAPICQAAKPAISAENAPRHSRSRSASGMAPRSSTPARPSHRPWKAVTASGTESAPSRPAAASGSNRRVRAASARARVVRFRGRMAGALECHLEQGRVVEREGPEDERGLDEVTARVASDRDGVDSRVQ